MPRKRHEECEQYLCEMAHKQIEKGSTEAGASAQARYNISTFDFFDTYLPQYKLAFTAQPTGPS